MCLGFLLGAATGAAGTYYGNKFTDKRLNKEQKAESKSLFKKLWKDHGLLLSEMKSDLNNPAFFYHRSFMVAKKNWVVNNHGPSLVYYLDEHQSLEQQLKILESYELISDISDIGSNIQKFQFSEYFVEHLRNVEI